MDVQNPSRKIAVIGAGPAGILAAIELQDAGYENITVYGKFEEAQCRTKHVEDVVADVGTCYVHSGYFNTIKKLVKRFDIHIKYLDADPKSVNSTSIHTSISPSIKEKIFTYLRLFYFLLHAVTWKFLKHSYLGRFLYGISFEKYLRRVGLGGMIKSFVFGPGGVAQGYGFLKDVNAYRLFRWFRPSIFITPIMNKRKRGTGIIAEGYGTLFKRAYDSISNHRETLINSVMPAENDQVKIVAENGKEEFYDSVIVACPLQYIKTPISGLFRKDTTQFTPFFSYLWTSESAPHFDDRMYILDYINEDKTDVISTLRLWGKTDSGKFLYWGVGYASEGIAKEILKQKLEEQVNNELELAISNCKFFEVFDYNVRFSAVAIRDGIHLKVRKAQGKNNIWYSGGMLSHWDVDSIHEFDIELVKKIVYQNNKSITNLLKFTIGRVWRFLVNI